MCFKNICLILFLLIVFFMLVLYFFLFFKYIYFNKYKQKILECICIIEVLLSSLIFVLYCVNEKSYGYIKMKIGI